MNIPLTGDPDPRKLRVWPGIVAVVLLLIARFVVKALIPGIQGFGMAIMGSLFFALAVFVWWAFFSRSAWPERLGGLALIAATLGVTWLLKHDSMWLPWLFAYAIPVLCIAFVAWAVATRNLPNRVRRATMVATVVVACGAWLLLRQDGINGDHNADFGWRWAASSEERLLAATSNEPPPTAAPAVAPTIAPVSSAATTASPSPTPATETAKPAAVETQAEWPGFRGPRRDGIVRGVRIKTDWSSSPPAQIWRRPVGPGWSSFAVNRDLVYTQEQRGEDEVVSCYKANTGQPVWSHRDKA
ncbi:MAG TPA: hypothetical protein VFR78_21290, partial [Pyrinomonadaceae bacterium]|nr:hypothetical protein [Pyrinomonadaceae bacterium]